MESSNHFRIVDFELIRSNPTDIIVIKIRDDIITKDILFSVDNGNDIIDSIITKQFSCILCRNEYGVLVLTKLPKFIPTRNCPTLLEYIDNYSNNYYIHMTNANKVKLNSIAKHKIDKIIFQ